MKFIIKINAYNHLRKILILNPVSPELEMGWGAIILAPNYIIFKTVTIWHNNK